jgi:hypothetical protein
MILDFSLINAPVVGNISLVQNLTASALLNSPLVHELIGHKAFEVLCSLLKGTRGKRLTRAQRRKLLNRRRRWFVDNIIMHHKRLHDRNREIVISSARDRVMLKRLGANIRKPMDQNSPTKWRDRVDGRDRGLSIRGRIDARRARARSRWLSVAGSTVTRVIV